MVLELNKAKLRAEMPDKASTILDSRTLHASHRRLAQLLTKGMTVLDIGCGTGAITKDIAEIVGETGRVVGVDSNPLLIEKAVELYNEVPNLTFETGDIYNLSYADEFDIVTSARVLQWLSEPKEALRKMIHAAKTGGNIIVLDYNHEKLMLKPQAPESFYTFYKAFLQWRTDAGMNNMIADQLEDMFTELGIHKTNVISQHESVSRVDNNFHHQITIWADVMASRGVQMVRDGFFLEDTLISTEKEYRKWIDQDAETQTMYLLSVEGIKTE